MRYQDGASGARLPLSSKLLRRRPEDFPVMPVEVVGFTLKPFGFFDGNPAVDLPHAPDAGSVLANGSCCANGNGLAH